MQNKLRLLNIFSAALVLLTVAGVLSAQTPFPTSSPILEQSSQSTPARPGLQQIQTSTTDELKPVYGLQAVLIETLDGKTVSAQLVDQAFNPASAIKLATALVALQTFGAQHRF